PAAAKPNEAPAPTGPQVCGTFEGCLDHALTLIGEPGLALEFGVSTGASLRRIAAGMPEGSRTIGFDAFEGLGAHWRDGCPRGSCRTRAPEVPAAELVSGLCAGTLPGWAAEHRGVAGRRGPGGCDLHSSTRDVLTHLGA